MLQSYYLSKNTAVTEGSSYLRSSSQTERDCHFTVADLFAGAGGLSLGFKRAGFDVLAAYDNWAPAVETYRLNLGSHIHLADITASLDIPWTTVIVGGPPCQGFSSAGMRRGDDQRNSLVSEFSKLVARTKPLAFVFENVEGFLTTANGKCVFELLDPLIEAGYRLHLRKINAANYGVPQHRKRVVAIGGLGWDPCFPVPSHAAFGAPGAHLANGAAAIPTPTFGNALAQLPALSASVPAADPDHVRNELSDSELERARLLKPGESMRDLPEELWHNSYKRRAFRRVMDGTPTERRGGPPHGLRRLRVDEPSKAITGASLRDFIHPLEDRHLTLRECATLQTFPLNFRFAGTSSEKIQLVGNAVPPILAEKIAKSLYDDLCTLKVSYSTGALLSFIPTSSSGMSPVLQQMSRLVSERYPPAEEPQYVGYLWP